VVKKRLLLKLFRVMFTGAVHVICILAFKNSWTGCSRMYKLFLT